MAKNKININLVMRRINSNKHKNYGNYYSVVMRAVTVNTRDLAEHLLSHDSLYTHDVIEGIIRKFATCIPELVAQGVAVKLDGMGTFYPMTESESIPEDQIEGANPNELVKGVHLRFLPESTNIDDLTSRSFKQKCSLVLAYKEEGTKKQGNLKLVPLGQKQDEEENP